MRVLLTCLAAVTLPFLFAAPATASSFTLTNTISLSDVDIKYFGGDGTHFLVAGNVYQNDPLYVLTTSGQLLDTYNPYGPPFSGVRGGVIGSFTWTGSDLVLSPGGIPLNHMTLPGGVVSDAYNVDQQPPGGIISLGFDGTHLLAAGYANGPAGALTVDLASYGLTSGVPPAYVELDSRPFVVNNNTDITGTPVYGIAVHNGDLFLGLQGLSDIYEFSYDTGIFVETIPTPIDFSVRGLTFIGDDLYVADRSTSTVYEFSPCDGATCQALPPTGPPSSVPEPSSVLLLGSGVLVAVGIRRHRRSAGR